MKRLNVIMNVLVLIYTALTFLVFSAGVKLMPWYEQDPMGIQIGVEILKITTPFILIILTPVLLLRNKLGADIYICIVSMVCLIFITNFLSNNSTEIFFAWLASLAIIVVHIFRIINICQTISQGTR